MPWQRRYPRRLQEMQQRRLAHRTERPRATSTQWPAANTSGEQALLVSCSPVSPIARPSGMTRAHTHTASCLEATLFNTCPAAVECGRTPLSLECFPTRPEDIRTAPRRKQTGQRNIAEMIRGHRKKTTNSPADLLYRKNDVGKT